jgi:diguanylate cyclase (GGDEF)-like protein/PAS domain S-box-containing protein
VTVSSGSGADRGSFVSAWARVLTASGYIAVDRAELLDRVGGFTDTLLAAVRADRLNGSAVERVGAALVELRCATPAALEASLRLIGAQLPSAAGRTSSALPEDRIPCIQAALAAGFVSASQAWIFREQEGLRRSALEARDGAEAARRATEARFHAMFTDAAIGIAITDTDGKVLEVNPAMATMLDYGVGELPTEPYLTDFLHPDDPPDLRRFFVEMVEGRRDHYRIERRFRKRDGSPLWTNITVSLVRDERGAPQYLVGMVEDNTERHQLSEQLRYQANHDPLTGLANRALFTERLHAAFDAGPDHRIGLCYLDLDGFKGINDTLGHVVGDKLLVKIASRLAGSVAGPGRTVARMGGDEFVVLVEGTSGPEQLVELAERILVSVAEPVQVGGHRLSVSASVGIVERPVSVSSPAEAMRDVDVTLHWAKVDGKNRWASYDPERNAREIARITLSSAMPEALERKEFYVDYQPLVRMSDEKLVGVEALVRWAHPEFGRLGPDRFIGLAEETGLIVPLGRWVLEEACARASTWREPVDRPLVVSVNLAVRQVLEPGLVDDIRAILDAAGLAPSSLQLELTESAIMGTTGEPLRALRTLADLGVRIAIDDFGTGYSNLAYLRHLPVHALKIAGSFVEGLRQSAADSVDARIVTALVSLGHTLGLEVIAEGVETRQQADRLREIGCDSAQGWLFAKPGPPEEIKRWLS